MGLLEGDGLDFTLETASRTLCTLLLHLSRNVATAPFNIDSCECMIIFYHTVVAKANMEPGNYYEPATRRRGRGDEILIAGTARVPEVANRQLVRRTTRMPTAGDV
jgi:hypothetical protein